MHKCEGRLRVVSLYGAERLRIKRTLCQQGVWIPPLLGDVVPPLFRDVVGVKGPRNLEGSTLRRILVPPCCSLHVKLKEEVLCLRRQVALRRADAPRRWPGLWALERVGPGDRQGGE